MLVFALALMAQTQTIAAANPARSGTAPIPVPQAVAVRAEVAPVIDGKDTDPIWSTVQPITGLRQWQPAEDAPARYRTEAKVAYDNENIYVFVRAFDPHPDSILRLLARRDTWTPSDKIWVMIDSYHDRRSGFEFGVNPAGVKIDIANTNDGNEDDAWDGIWDVATTVDSLGWTAEYKIPLSQLRYPPGATVMGFAVWRDLQRYSEREAWPVLRRSRPGFVSQFGELTGLQGLASPRRLEMTPYTVAKSAAQQATSGSWGQDQSFSAGADLKYGVTSNLTLNATVNPDFGQVEADPAQLNLSAFETFFSERRPFFVEGGGQYSFSVNCNVVNCSGENLFYSRRIGRAPQLGGGPGVPTSSRILGAAKLTGHLPSGLGIAMLDAVTQHVTDPSHQTVEPTTNYFVTRLQQDFHRGESGIGGMFTMVNRDLDAASDPYLRRTALVGALDFRHRMFHGRYEVSGSVDYSRVAGTPQAIARTQLSPVHFLQRPDGGVTFDSTRTSLSGDAQEIQFGKVGGGTWRFQTSLQRHSAGFEVNDLGFLQRTDQLSWATWTQLRTQKPSRLQRQLFANFNWWQQWTTNGLPTDRGFNTNTHTQLPNRWWVHAGGTIGQIGNIYCDFNCTRGGPAVRQDISYSPWFGFEGDGRNVIVPNLFFNFNSGDGGRSHYFNTNGNVNFRVSSQFTPSIGFGVTRMTNDVQPRGTFVTANTPHYLFSRLEQRQISMNIRFDYTMTRTLSLQVYANPFVSKGSYTDTRELSANPRAADYSGRYQAYSDTSVTNHLARGFNFKAFNSNVVLRWEYRPGSTLFVVWQQGRDDFQNAQGTRPLSGDLTDIMRLQPKNTFLVKASYWLSW